MNNKETNKIRLTETWPIVETNGKNIKNDIKKDQKKTLLENNKM